MNEEKNINQPQNPAFLVGAVIGSLWEYGTCNNRQARRHRINKNVQFVLWKAGEQGHKEDYWHNFDSSWWSGFTQTN